MKIDKEKEIAFIGQITAGVTHEINNALASIMEISGLLDDLISISSDDKTPHNDKFVKSLHKIKEQIKRSVKYTTNLNKFSHFTDSVDLKLEINDIIEHFIFITQRFARIKNVELKYLEAETSKNFNTYPILMEMILFNSMQYFLIRSTEGGKLVIQLLTKDEGFIIKIIFRGEINNISTLFKDNASSEELMNVSDLILMLKGKVEYDFQNQTINLILLNELDIL